jgi:hypothetical protein
MPPQARRARELGWLKSATSSKQPRHDREAERSSTSLLWRAIPGASRVPIDQPSPARAVEFAKWCSPRMPVPAKATAWARLRMSSLQKRLRSWVLIVFSLM